MVELEKNGLYYLKKLRQLKQQESKLFAEIEDYWRNK